MGEFHIRLIQVEPKLSDFIAGPLDPEGSAPRRGRRKKLKLLNLGWSQFPFLLWYRV